jgi:hypothetical protein
MMAILSPLEKKAQWSPTHLTVEFVYIKLRTRCKFYEPQVGNSVLKRQLLLTILLTTGVRLASMEYIRVPCNR